MYEYCQYCSAQQAGGLVDSSVNGLIGGCDCGRRGTDDTLFVVPPTCVQTLPPLQDTGIAGNSEAIRVPFDKGVGDQLPASFLVALGRQQVELLSQVSRRWDHAC